MGYEKLNKESKATIELMIADGIITKESAEKYFPELKESEDEKIRKDLIRLVEESTALRDYYELRKMTSWLEALRERIKPQNMEKPAEYTLEQAAGIFLDALSSTPYNNKPITDAQVITKELLRFLEDASSYNPDATNEQKPAWSEEEEKNIDRIIDTILCAKSNRNGIPKALYTDEILDELVGWLKSIKDRVQPQPKQKQEWNEEDSKNMKECVIAVSMSEGHTLEEKEQLEKWLKSLCHQKQCGYNPYKEVVESIAEMCKKYKLPTSDLSDFLDNVMVKCTEAKEYDAIFPQTTWKPSDEMLEALYRATPKCVMEISEDEILLDKLYQGLKYGRVL